MSDTVYIASAVGVCAAVTMLVRGLPYLMFGGKRQLPKMVTYLGSVLPSSIMIILVVYCLRNIKLTVFPYGLAELISVAVVLIMQIWKKNTFLSILLGTACYMILIRTVF
jgi:branched-subunit amino acid transport protein AzlD